MGHDERVSIGMTVYTRKSSSDFSMTERPLVRFLFSALILAAVFYTALNYMDELYSDAEVFKYDLLAEEFETSINIVRMGWNERGRPNRFTMRFQFEDLQSQRLAVDVSKNGWPINVAEAKKEINCLNLWQYFAEHLTTSASEFTPLVKVELTENTCLYRRQQGGEVIWTMKYDTQSGRVLIEYI